MKIVKYSTGFSIADCTEDNLIAFYNIAINYRSYLKELLNKPDNVLLTIAPGKNAKEVRDNLKIQIETANDYIAVWHELMLKADDKQPQA